MTPTPDEREPEQSPADGAAQPPETRRSGDGTDGSGPGRDADATARDVVARVLARAGTAVDAGGTRHTAADGQQLDLQERSALRRVAGLSTELEDVTEVEYRQLRLERVVLVGLWSRDAADAEISLRELAALAETAGSQVLDGVLQRRQTPDPGTYLGQGKAAQLAAVVQETGADTVVVDGELAPSQRRALEDIVKVKVVDRTALILDIFAQHAKSKEGKAQVELAQLEYLLPRLRGWGDSMSRQAGGQVGSAGAGMGSRGPGETKIELDRRRIRGRMAKLRREIAAMAPARETKRASRKRHAVPSVAIVGYTNAGKSSLLNALTGAGVLVENALFATLDPTIRRTRTPDGRTYTLADTVGFVRNLPHQLVEAFRSTLEEAGDADLLLHVVDAGHPDPDGQIAAVRAVLADVPGAMDVPEIVVLNKADRADPDTVDTVRRREKDAVLVSAHTGLGIEHLLERVAAALPRPGRTVDVLLPYDRGDLLSRVHATGEIEREEHTADGTSLRARVDDHLAAELVAAGSAVHNDDRTDAVVGGHS
ncbi:GTPase HflX [Luteimicrobium subarcticum]|uniref:GTPase HflX n=1 Tax=Luteimicrobium subarcticum TaxID=620910 RepID=A0A2M8WTU9_9MICO|nr:GTPase HflX [Luteimicrobium subarcticum]PJI94365.1 GTP-binding protein HflX [Luteimicrobium subarcticum]